MTLRTRQRKLTAGIAAIGAAGLVTATLAVSSGTSSAAMAELKLQHDCTFPLIGTHRMTTEITTSDLPSSIGVGEATPTFEISAVSTLPPDVTEGMTIIDGKTIEGVAKASAVVEAPEGDLPVVVPNAVPKTTVPAEGDLVVKASGKAPSLTFGQPGTAKITVGDFALEMIIRDDQGAPITLPGSKTWPCKLVSGQNNVLHTFTITGGEDEGGVETGEPGGEDGETAEEAGGVEAGGVEAGGDEAGGVEAGGDEAGDEAGGEEAGGEEAGGDEAGGEEAGDETAGEEAAGEDVAGEDFGGNDFGDFGGADVGDFGGDVGDAASGGVDAGGAGTGTGSGTGGLALTGASVLVPTGLGVVLIGAGALLLIRRRRAAE